MRGIKTVRCGARPFLLIMVRLGSGIGIMYQRGLSNAGLPRNWLFDAAPLLPLAPATTVTELVLVRPRRMNVAVLRELTFEIRRKGLAPRKSPSG